MQVVKSYSFWGAVVTVAMLSWESQFDNLKSFFSDDQNVEILEPKLQGSYSFALLRWLYALAIASFMVTTKLKLGIKLKCLMDFDRLPPNK